MLPSFSSAGPAAAATPGPLSLRGGGLSTGALVMAAALLLAGCNATSPKAAAAAPAPAAAAAPAPEETRAASDAPPNAPAPALDAKSPDPVGQVLARSDQTLRMTPAELTKEIARLSESEDASADTPLLLATALAQTRQPVDTARALGLVQRVLANNAPTAQALHPLARWMESRLLQQRRLEDLLERQTQQLRDAQRRNDQLNERLEAVRAIERSLTTRPAPAAGTNPPARPAP